ncbi:MAG: phage terminase large subunit family protein [Synergistaceae bacterium]|jgi:predicted RNA-binding Zn-ribbon protein involved in translation (DUF1610 family)|nr:phage terminase large subunit family protein [Synergistaceae bacterium]
MTRAKAKGTGAARTTVWPCPHCGEKESIGVIEPDGADKPGFACKACGAEWVEYRPMLRIIQMLSGHDAIEGMQIYPVGQFRLDADTWRLLDAIHGQSLRHRGRFAGHRRQRAVP